MNKIVEKLYNLSKANPSLPVLCKVDNDTYIDDFAWSTGDLYNVEIREYFLSRDKEVLIKGLDDIADCVEALGYTWYELSDERLEEIYDTIKWEKAIFLTVGLPLDKI